MKNVLIISYNFPPVNNIAARRFGEMVSFMEQHGWKPHIITSQSHGVLPVEVDEKQCIRIAIHPQVGNRIDIIDYESNKMPDILEKLRLILGKTNIRFRMFDRTILNWGKIVKNETATILTNFPKIDLVITSYGPAASIWLGRWFSFKYGAPWIADYRDLGALRRDEKPSFAYKIDCIIEKQILKSCSGITTVSKTLSDLLNKAYNKPCQVIYNGWAQKTEKQSVNNLMGNYIYYAGQLYSQQLESVYICLEALKHFDFLQFKIRSLGPAELERKILDYANTIGIGKRVHIMPATNPNIVEIEMRQAIVNLVVDVLDENDQWTAGSLTGKFLQLMPGRVPILSIARPDNEMGEILERSGRGRLCSSIDQITNFLNEVQAGKETFSGDIDIVNEFSKENQAENLCRFFDEILLLSNKSN